MFELIDAILEKVLWKWGQTVANGGKRWQVEQGSAVGAGPPGRG